MNRNKKHTVSKINIYHGEGSPPKVDAPERVRFAVGPDPGPKLKNEDIESDAVRGGLNEEEANICISVMPGEDKIGELNFDVQFEGKKGMTDECMMGQNDLANRLGDWLNEIFADAEEPWTFEIHAEPCPKSGEPYRAMELANRLGTVQEHTHLPTEDPQYCIQDRHDLSQDHLR